MALCVQSRASGFSFCHGYTVNPVYRVAIEIQNKEAMPVRRYSGHNCIDPDSADLTYKLQVHVCLDAL